MTAKNTPAQEGQSWQQVLDAAAGIGDTVGPDSADVPAVIVIPEDEAVSGSTHPHTGPQQPSPVTGRLKPAHETFHQMMHDAELQEAAGGLDAIVVGYHDRFLGTLDCPLEEFAELEIPFHRVRHYRTKADVPLNKFMIWDREGRLNNIGFFKGNVRPAEKASESNTMSDAFQQAFL